MLDSPKPRFCRIRKRTNFAGYGFNLHAEKGKTGQFIGEVDDDSPAADACVRPGDRIIEVNGVNISNENHGQVVNRIKAGSNTGGADETCLLLADAATDRYYLDKRMFIRGDMPGIEKHDSENPTHRIKDMSHKARVCVLRPLEGFEGLGFFLHFHRDTFLEYVGKVDAGSPAALVGVQEGDRIVEVNGACVDGLDHDQVVGNMKANPDKVVLLLVDAAADKHFKESGIRISGSMKDLQRIDVNHNESAAPPPTPPRAPPSPASPPPAPPSAPSPALPAQAGAPPAGGGLRLCVVRRWSDTEGYGFNLNAAEGRGGHYVGKIDVGSPAAAAGLRQGDKLFEVSYADVTALSHLDVVQKIKDAGSQVEMLVAEQAVYEYMNSEGQEISSKSANVTRIECPHNKPVAAAMNGDVALAEAAGPAAPKLRLCHLFIWDNYSGYGFNLHAKLKSVGNFIGSLEEGSPAEAGGVRKGDRIIEVNDVSVLEADHSEVVQCVRDDPRKVRLLMADKAAEAHYTQQGVVMRGSLPGVERIYCPTARPEKEEEALEQEREEEEERVEPAGDSATVASETHSEENKENEEVEERQETPHENGNSCASSVDHSKRISTASSEPSTAEATSLAEATSAPVAAEEPPADVEPPAAVEVEPVYSKPLADRPASAAPQDAPAAHPGGPNYPGELKMSAKEMMEKLKANKKKDSRLDSRSFQAKREQLDML